MNDDDTDGLELKKLMADALREKELIGYIDAETRDRLQAMRERLAPGLGKLDDAIRQTHEINREILSADLEDNPPLSTPDDNPVLMQTIKTRAIAAEVIRQIDEILKGDG